MNDDFAQRVGQYLEAVGPIGEAANPNWRPRSQRRAYPVVQWIAPRYGDDIPQESQFREVRCRNISTSGLAFYWPELPDFQHAVVRLGNGQTTLYVTARVIRIEPRGGPNGNAYLIGCRFTGRIPTPDPPRS